jgi:hypothetical protein
MSQRLARLNAGSLLRKVRAICVGVAHPVANTAPEGAGPLCERRPAGLDDGHIDDSSSTLGLRHSGRSQTSSSRLLESGMSASQPRPSWRDFTATGQVNRYMKTPKPRQPPHLRRAHHRLMCPALADYSLVGPTQSASRRAADKATRRQAEPNEFRCYYKTREPAFGRLQPLASQLPPPPPDLRGCGRRGVPPGRRVTRDRASSTLDPRHVGRKAASAGRMRGSPNADAVKKGSRTLVCGDVFPFGVGGVGSDRIGGLRSRGTGADVQGEDRRAGAARSAGGRSRHAGAAGGVGGVDHHAVREGRHPSSRSVFPSGNAGLPRRVARRPCPLL